MPLMGLTDWVFNRLCFHSCHHSQSCKIATFWSKIKLTLFNIANITAEGYYFNVAWKYWHRAKKKKKSNLKQDQIWNVQSPNRLEKRFSTIRLCVHVCLCLLGCVCVCVGGCVSVWVCWRRRRMNCFMSATFEYPVNPLLSNSENSKEFFSNTAHMKNKQKTKRL